MCSIMSYVAYYSQKNKKGKVINWFRIEKKENEKVVITEQKNTGKENENFVRNNTNNFFEEITLKAN